jgi:hypothetical protein
MKTSMTPGPWYTDGSRIYHQQNPGGRKTWIADTSGDPGASQQIANGVAIAAVPELIALAEYIRGIWKFEAIRSGVDTRALELAEAALAKAGAEGGAR